MEATVDIPPEMRASVECNALFDALRRGDYAAAASAQNRLRELGWTVTREDRPKRVRKGAHQS
jgi:hypothetical protein